MKIKTSDLTDAALDYAVAKAKGMEIDGATVITGESYWDDDGLQWPVEFEPSTNWSQAGPIIEREQIAIDFDADPAEGGPCAASRRDDLCYWVGPTPLIAAMRCLVSSKLGDEVEVPEELT